MTERNEIHRIPPCHRYDLEGIQTWLEDMAKDGWLLETDGYSLGLFTFQRCEPITCRYRLHVTADTNRYGQHQEYLELLRESGWVYVADFQGFNIFRTENPDAVEVNTDPTVQATTLKKLKRETLSRLLFFGFYFIIYAFQRRFVLFYLFRSAVTMGPLTVTMFLILIAMAILVPLVDLWMIRKLRKKLLAGHLLCSPKEWKKSALAHRIYYLTPLAIGILCLCLFIHAFLISVDQKALGTLTEDPPFITVEDMSESGYEALDPPLSGSNHYVKWSNLLAPVNYEWREYGRIEFEGKTTKGQLILYYHETISPEIAQGLADDYYAYETSNMGWFQNQEVSDYGLDQVRVFGDSVTHILIRHENTVILALYNQWDTGETPDWQLWLEAMAQYLLHN